MRVILLVGAIVAGVFSALSLSAESVGGMGLEGLRALCERQQRQIEWLSKRCDDLERSVRAVAGRGVAGMAMSPVQRRRIEQYLNSLRGKNAALSVDLLQFLEIEKLKWELGVGDLTPEYCFPPRKLEDMLFDLWMPEKKKKDDAPRW